jgi:hypothetical protein
MAGAPNGPTDGTLRGCMATCGPRSTQQAAGRPARHGQQRPELSRGLVEGDQHRVVRKRPVLRQQRRPVAAGVGGGHGGRRLGVARLQVARPAAAFLGFGRIGVSDIEEPNMSVNLV